MVAPKGNEQPSLGLTPLSRVRLDELLQEMLVRVGEVVTSRERLRALLDAVVGIGTDLDLLACAAISIVPGLTLHLLRR